MKPVAILCVSTMFAFLLNGCGRGCSSGGCNDSVHFQLADNTLTVGGSYNFLFCLDGKCTTGTVNGAPGAVPCSDTSGLCLASFGTPSSVKVLVPDPNGLDDGKAHQISFKLTSGDRSLAELSQAVTFRSFEPNGSGCEPVCRQIDVRVP